MTSMDPTAADQGMEHDPQMVSGTTGLGNDVNSTGGLSGSVPPIDLSTADPNMTDELGADSDSLSELDNDPSTVSGGPDMGGTMGGTGGMDESSRHVLDSDAMEIEGSTSMDTDAAVGRDSGMSVGIGEDAGDLTTGTDGGDMLGYGSDVADSTAGAFGGAADTDGSMTAPYGGNTDDPTGDAYMSHSDAPVDDTNNDDGSGI